MIKMSQLESPFMMGLRSSNVEDIQRDSGVPFVKYNYDDQPFPVDKKFAEERKEWISRWQQYHDAK